MSVCIYKGDINNDNLYNRIPTRYFNMSQIQIIARDITTVTNGIIVHGCNCQGVMGGGVAKAIYQQWPVVKQDYLQFHSRYKGTNCSLLGQSRMVRIDQDLAVINGWTQVHYGNDGKLYADLTAIRTVIRSAVIAASMWGQDVYMPKIGCDLGGLSWETDVYPMLTTLCSEQLNNETANIIVCVIN